jgi:molybdopterin-guanine dinucleotide biosynthesis protein A
MHSANIIGLILAGGQARRMGGVDKALLMLRGQTLIERAVAGAKPQVSELIINANGDVSRFARLGVPVISDRIQGFLGPLAGILAGLEWMRENRPDANFMASFACDCPFFPTDMVRRLLKTLQTEKASVAIAASGTRHHPVFALWSAAIEETSESVLKDRGLRKMDDFVDTLPNARVVFSSDLVDPFFNVNTPDDLARAEALMAGKPPIR